MKRRTNARAVATEPVVIPAERIVVTPVPGRVGPLLHRVSDRVGPFAQSAADRVGPLASTAAGRVNAAAGQVYPLAQSAVVRIVPAAQTAAGRVSPLAQAAAGRVGPLAQQAAGRVTPYAQQAVGRVSPYAVSAIGRVTPYAVSAAGRVSPLASTAKQRGAHAAHTAVEALTPRLDEAFGRVSPAVEMARGRVTEDFLPRLSNVLNAAATAPGLVEASKAAVEAVREELPVPAPAAPSAKGGRLLRVGLVAAAAGVVAFVIKKTLGHKDADWQAARPTTAYTPSQPGTVSPADLAKDDVDAPRIDIPSTTGAEGASEVPGVTDDLSGSAVRSEVGEGVYVGSEPPAGFYIKGNERSMKYHTPESSSYNETTAEVWFSSEQSAAENGFTRAHG